MSSATVLPSAGRCDFLLQPGGSVRGRIRVPGDKSISHRALLLGALAQDETRISNFLESQDCLATLKALRTLGVPIDHARTGHVRIQGVGVEGLRMPARTLDCGNSATSMRLLSGVLAGQPFAATLDGDESLRRRPMQRVIEPLTLMGARFENTGGHAPLTVHGCRPLKSLRYKLPVASAQVKSAILLAGLQATGETWVQEPAESRDHTERMLQALGCRVLRDGDWLGVAGGSVLHAADISVPGDLSSAAFFLVGAAISPGAHLAVEGVGINPTRAGVLRLLQRMGADIHVRTLPLSGAEPAADIEVQGGELHGIEIAAADVPLAIDELPVLLVAAAVAHGQTRLQGAAELRVKESDRLAAMAAGLRTLGVPVEIFPDGMQITGVDQFRGGEIDSFGDHRIAMAFAMAALRATQPVRIRDCRNVDTSFPGFADTARGAGMQLRVAGTG
ncbi:MAG TPA: 3-phosphoshikimate 1-carboxyvinyltransferase [Gammaproteobacteria bacterium]|nr:3-phosphoshikimate 1-carboxyvinyltransferase [Gammaproteobacteria bacterium]